MTSQRQPVQCRWHCELLVKALLTLQGFIINIGSEYKKLLSLEWTDLGLNQPWLNHSSILRAACSKSWCRLNFLLFVVIVTGEFVLSILNLSTFRNSSTYVVHTYVDALGYSTNMKKLEIKNLLKISL
jgi:hypothetical protein